MMQVPALHFQHAGVVMNGVLAAVRLQFSIWVFSSGTPSLRTPHDSCSLITPRPACCAARDNNHVGVPARHHRACERSAKWVHDWAPCDAGRRRAGDGITREDPGHSGKTRAAQGVLVPAAKRHLAEDGRRVRRVPPRAARPRAVCAIRALESGCRTRCAARAGTW